MADLPRAPTTGDPAPMVRPLILLAACLLTGACTTTEQASPQASPQALPMAAVPASPPADLVRDDVALGQDHFAAGRFGLAELHFRKAAEARAGDAQAWTGLAAAYDQLRRFELADRAYAQAFKLAGPTPELLNNRGHSYMLRGDVARASRDLAAAAARDPGDERIQANLAALDGRARKKR